MKLFYKKLLIILFLWQTSHAKVLIWDLGGVLCKVSKSAMINQLGFSSLFWYTLLDGNAASIKSLVFDVLSNFEQSPAHIPKVYDNDGIELPYCMYKLLIGKQTGAELLRHLEIHIKKLAKQGFFISNCERQLVENTVRVLFTPQLFSQSIKPKRVGIKLLKQCLRSPKKHKHLILSNWDKDSFELFYYSKRGQKILSYFNPENIIISGNIGYAKPDPRCFEYMIKHYKLDPKECIFIDDQIENIEMARKYGLAGILFTDNYNSMYNMLLAKNIF